MYAQRALEHGRAYVIVETAGISERVVGETLKGSVRLVNVGQTPAYNVSTKVDVFVIPLGGEADIADHSDVVRSQLVVGPGRPKLADQSALTVLTQIELDQLTDTASIVVVAGCVVYDDVFGKTWWTQFSHIYRGPAFNGTYHTELDQAGGPI